MLDEQELLELGFKKEKNSNCYYFDVNLLYAIGYSFYKDYDHYTFPHEIMCEIANNEEAIIRNSLKKEPFFGFLRINYIIDTGCSYLNLYFDYYSISIHGDDAEDVIKAILGKKSLYPFETNYYHNGNQNAVRIIDEMRRREWDTSNEYCLDDSYYDEDTLPLEALDCSKRGDAVVGVVKGQIVFTTLSQDEEEGCIVNSYAEDLTVLKIDPIAEKIFKKVFHNKRNERWII